MQNSEAFLSLGYTLGAVRTDWSAESSEGICLTIWKREIDWSDWSMDSRIRGGPIEQWGKKQGNKKRIVHAARALAEFEGWIDAILISGKPGQSYEDAQPWLPTDKGGKRWRVTFLDEFSGHIRIEAQLP